MRMFKRIGLGLLAIAAAVTPARSEVTEIKIARQFGLQYLPMVLMEKHGLVEKAAAAAKIDLKATWLQISAASINESLISGSIHVAATGLGPLILVWDRTHGSLGVKGIAALSEMPMILTSRNPSFKSMKDITSKDRIALPAVALGSMQAITLKMAAAKLYGKENSGRFDANMVAMTHPDGTVAMLTGKHEVNAHFTTPPYSYIQLQNAEIHKVMSSYDVIGGGATLITLNAAGKFYQENPTVVKVLIAAMNEATKMANDDRKKALDEYIEMTKEKLAPEVIAAALADKDLNYQTTPRGTLPMAEFMHELGAIKRKPTKWQDLFFEPIHSSNGS